MASSYRLSIPHMFDKKRYAAPANCHFCRKKIWGAGYHCSGMADLCFCRILLTALVCKYNTHKKCVKAVIETSSCGENFEGSAKAAGGYYDNV